MSAGRGGGWWELTVANWDPSSGLQKCRACLLLAKRLARRQTAEERRAKQRAYYHAHRPQRLAWRHAYHAAHRDAINAARRAKYAAARQQQNGLWDD